MIKDGINTNMAFESMEEGARRDVIEIRVEFLFPNHGSVVQIVQPDVI